MGERGAAVCVSCDAYRIHRRMSIFRTAIRQLSTMTQYIFFLHASPEVFAGYSPSEFQPVKTKYAKWRDQMLAEGRLVAGNKLQDGNGRVIRGSNVTDGP